MGASSLSGEPEVSSQAGTYAIEIGPCPPPMLHRLAASRSRMEVSAELIHPPCKKSSPRARHRRRGSLHPRPASTPEAHLEHSDDGRFEALLPEHPLAVLYIHVQDVLG